MDNGKIYGVVMTHRIDEEKQLLIVIPSFFSQTFFYTSGNIV